MLIDYIKDKKIKLENTTTCANIGLNIKEVSNDKIRKNKEVGVIDKVY